MNRIIVTTILILTFFSISAQEIIKKQSKNEFNKWSVELNIGNNKPIQPFSPGYFTSADNTALKLPVINHFDIGVRRMFSTKFGIKLDVGSDIIENQKGSSSRAFKSQQNIVSIQTIYNLGKILGFDSFTNTFGLLAHFGIQISQFNFGNLTDNNGGIIYGLTPLVKLSNRFVASGDFSFLTNTRQHLFWNGGETESKNNLTGKINYFKLGLTYYWGKNEKHADWYTTKTPVDSDPEIEKRLDVLESLLNDMDKDGIVDYLDIQNNTPNGVIVDSKGKFIDVNGNGIPDDLEVTGEDNSELSQSDAPKILAEKGYVNVFYDVNKDEPKVGSTSNIYYITKFLMTYPITKVILIGYADLNEKESSNLDLIKRRAENLKKVFIANSIDSERISIVTRGDEKIDKTKLQSERREFITVFIVK